MYRGFRSLTAAPDSDGDGVIDSEDQCPELYGPKEEAGCPDSDGDRVHDHEDKCPYEAGLIENSGCPFADTDGDGIRDIDDKCPNVAGVVENEGCPAIEKEDQEVLNTAFENLEFESGKSKIAMSSYTSLVELANLLKKKPDWNLLIEGHTDNVGSRATNIRLSKERAQAVADFLTSQGIETARLTVVGHGPDKPVAPENTREGRRKNRRVEMTVLFEVFNEN
ncbi:Thrombospondin type 3 repeat:OmpA/MotB [Fulvivirga imtechensis AK7]|uniref:Thrombospondin type 3 repeat:OmpA/MotB n=2 Tax=Fulvivirga TaxID=396811 RepID=L8JX80_9BACT|nr:Thrombospondin type 3 repeat:OmpA/MotB [Fulvivirga imtechensis AK7]